VLVSISKEIVLVYSNTFLRTNTKLLVNITSDDIIGVNFSVKLQHFQSSSRKEIALFKVIKKLKIIEVVEVRKEKSK